jgi:hypothetical protein
MTTFAVMIVLVALYGLASFYFRNAGKLLARSKAPWDRLHHAAEEAISDPDMPQPAAAFAAAAVLCAGCGCITRQLLIDAFTGRLRRSVGPKPQQDQMTPEQAQLFSRVVVNAIYYDSLRAPVSGFFLRRLIMPGLKKASESPSPKPKVEVDRMVASSTAAIEHRPEGRKVLAMA